MSNIQLSPHNSDNEIRYLIFDVKHLESKNQHAIQINHLCLKRVTAFLLQFVCRCNRKVISQDRQKVAQCNTKRVFIRGKQDLCYCMTISLSSNFRTPNFLLFSTFKIVQNCHMALSRNCFVFQVALIEPKVVKLFVRIFTN